MEEVATRGEKSKNQKRKEKEGIMALNERREQRIEQEKPVRSWLSACRPPWALHPT